MISIEKLKEHARFKSYNLGQAEKDYYQEIILFILYREFGQELVFKGGTALTKCYGFDRFSEDLDFNFKSEKNIEKIISSGLESFYISYKISKEFFKKSFSLIVWIEGALFNGSKTSLCKVSLDFSYRKKQITNPVIKKLGLNIDEIPSFDVSVMDQKEILSEKIRAIMTRDKARDVYDTYFLIKKGVSVNIADLNTKLSIYNLIFSKNLFKEKLLLKNKIWDKEMRHLTKSYPDFEECKNEILRYIIKLKD